MIKEPELGKTVGEDRVREAPRRMDWVDNLRTLTIFLVVNMHACVTYSHVGSWYFNAPPEPTIPQKIPFFFWQAHLQSFFMGLLFFLAAYYADRSLARRGAGAFLIERLRRLGIPSLLYMLAIEPFIIIVLHPGYEPPSVGGYYRNALSYGNFLGHSGPMWFAFALLVFSVVFALIRPHLAQPKARRFRFGPAIVAGIGLFTGLASFLVRTVEPQGSSVLNMQLCYFSQYIVAFGLGVWVSRHDWLNKIATDLQAKKIGIFALVVGPLAWLGIVIAMLPAIKRGSLPLNGGWNAFALSYAVWEQMTGFGLAVGAMALCARKLNRRTKISGWLSDRSFAVYFLHPPILIALTLWVQPIRTSALSMAVALTVLATVASFAIADLARRIPLLKEIL
jgi:glucan biosynthesis protein C